MILLSRPAATWSLLAHVIAMSTDGNNVTSAAIDTTGADLIVVGVFSSHTTGVAYALSDSAANSWGSPAQNANVIYQGAVSGGQDLYFLHNPVTSAAHTFTVTGTALTNYPTVAVLAFRGSIATPLDQHTGFGQNSSTINFVSIQPGSITPAQNNEVVVSLLTSYAGALAIDSGFTLVDAAVGVAGQSYPGASAYLVQVTAAPVNPTWSWTAGSIAAATIASFKHA